MNSQLQNAVLDAIEQMASAWPTHRNALFSNVENDMNVWAEYFERLGAGAADVPLMAKAAIAECAGDPSRRAFPPNLADFENAFNALRREAGYHAHHEQALQKAAAPPVIYNRDVHGETYNRRQWLQMFDEMGWELPSEANYAG